MLRPWDYRDSLIQVTFTFFFTCRAQRITGEPRSEDQPPTSSPRFVSAVLFNAFQVPKVPDPMVELGSGAWL